jgi:hypothetical protein
MFQAKVMVTLCILVLAAGYAAAAEPASYPTREVVAPVGGPVYVVDQADPKASDENAGTADAPWKTIGKAAATVKAGDTVYVMEGEYKEQIKFAHSGAEGKPITVKGLPRQQARVGLVAEKGKSTTSFNTIGCNYLRLEGLLIVDSDVGVAVDSDHVTIVDNRFEGVQSVPIDSVQLSMTDKLLQSPLDVYMAFNTITRSGKGIVTGGIGWLFERNAVTELFCFNKGDADYTRPFGEKHILRQNYFGHSTRADIKGSHTDAFQVFDNQHLISRDILAEDNFCTDFAEGVMMEVHYPADNTIKNWTMRRNIVFQRGVAAGWAYQGLTTGCQNSVIDHNTVVGGGSGGGSDSIHIDNNIMYNGLYLFTKGAVLKDCSSQKNIIFYPSEKIPVTGLSHVPTDYSKDLLNLDPLFVDVAKDNVRLKKGSPAIAAGTNGTTVGALEYPNVYYVDVRHGGASDEGYGYPGRPYKTIAKSLSVADAGETVLLRGGVYRELVKPAKAGLTIKAAKGEKVVISGADEISGWKRAGEKWTAPLAAKPTKVLRNGQALKDFTYDDGSKAIMVSGFDPRLVLMETVVRQNAIDLSAAPDTKVEGLETVNTLGEGKVK